MKVLIIAKEDFLGAGKAAFRLYEAFKRKGSEVCMLVKNKESDNEDIIQYDKLVKASYYYRGKQFLKNRLFKPSVEKIDTDPNYYFFGLDDLSQNVFVKLIVKELPFIPEIIIVTWTSGFFSAKDLYHLQKLTKAKMYAYPMDMSILTGGCHYAWDCEGFKNDCDRCPAIIDPSKKEIAFKNLQSKKEYYSKAGIEMVVPSEQLLCQSKESALFINQPEFKKVLIPVDEVIYNSKSRNKARDYFKLDNNLKIIFFGASFTNEKRKGISLLIEALTLLKFKYIMENKSLENIKVLIAGNQPANQNKEEVFPFSTTYLGYIKENEVFSLAYQAANVFINSSIQDSGPMMINEAIMCGTPVVTFNLGVASDLVIDEFSGYKVQIGDLKGLANSLYDILENNSLTDNDAIALLGFEKTSYGAFQPNQFYRN